MRPLITLTTDFGLYDPFVGIMKGVILNIEPGARIIDITHNIEPHNILQAARVLGATYPWYPRKTIHIIVVDPNVGGPESIKNSITNFECSKGVPLTRKKSKFFEIFQNSQKVTKCQEMS